MALNASAKTAGLLVLAAVAAGLVFLAARVSPGQSDPYAEEEQAQADLKVRQLFDAEVDVYLDLVELEQGKPAFAKVRIVGPEPAGGVKWLRLHKDGSADHWRIKADDILAVKASEPPQE